MTKTWTDAQCDEYWAAQTEDMKGQVDWIINEALPGRGFDESTLAVKRIMCAIAEIDKQVDYEYHREAMDE